MAPAGIAGWFPGSPVLTLSGACYSDCIGIPPHRGDFKGIRLPGGGFWRRRKAEVKKSPGRSDPYTREPPQELDSTSHPHARRLPQELFELIIAHIPPDTPALKSCSTVCRSWYIAALPHLHHTATLWGQASDPTRMGLVPLHELGDMRFLPFVKQLRILQRYGYADPWFLPTLFDSQSLVYFSALTNVQELVVDELDLRAFTPQAQLYFGQFTPTLRSLTLRTPRGNHNQLLYFLGLFQNLDDLKLIYTHAWVLEPDPAPVPQSPLSLEGRLTLKGFNGEVLMRSLSRLSGGLRFRYMDLLDVGGARSLLEACADTLEALRVHPVGWTGRGYSQEFSPI